LSLKKKCHNITLGHWRDTWSMKTLKDKYLLNILKRR